jgi:hypothetical protein
MGSKTAARKTIRSLRQQSKAARTRGRHFFDEGPGFTRRYAFGELVGEERERMLELARECGRAAYTTADMAKVFGVAERTLFLWMAEDYVFRAAFELNAAMCDARVESALYKRAVGYSQRVTKVLKDNNAPGGHITVDVIEHVPGDVAAQIFWLKNRDKARWRDGIEITTPDTDDSVDVRKLAMAVMNVLGRAAKEPPIEIEATAEEVKSDDKR